MIFSFTDGVDGVVAQYENSDSCLFKSEYKLKPFTVASPGKRVLYHLVLIIFPDPCVLLYYISYILPMAMGFSG